MNVSFTHPLDEQIKAALNASEQLLPVGCVVTAQFVSAGRGAIEVNPNEIDGRPRTIVCFNGIRFTTFGSN